MTIDDIKENTTFRLKGKLVHVRAIVDDYQYVLARWSNRKGWWYAIEHKTYLELLVRDGVITEIKHDTSM
jgi:hypothetical protein